MASSAPGTPRAGFATPRRAAPRAQATPDCYSKVTLETPNSGKRRSRQEKCDEPSNLTVAVRVRPMNARELAHVGAASAVKIKDQELVVCAGSGSGYVEHIFQVGLL